jgi:FixJ family two-component response regulator
VLVVDDEENLRNAVVTILRRSGFEVLEARDGSAAIDILRRDGASVGVILLDVTIPGCSSQEIADEAAKLRPGVRVILTSGYGEDVIMGSFGASPVHGFIRKPFRSEELVRAIQTASRRRV